MKRRFVLLTATIAALAVLVGGLATASAATTTTLSAASTLKAVTGTAVVQDYAASKGKAFALHNSNVWATGTISVPTANSTLVIGARGANCQGAPTFAVKVDGKEAIRAKTTSSSYYSEFSSALKLTKGTHTITAAMTIGPYTGAGCDANVYLDTIKIKTPSGTTAPATPGTPNGAFSVKGTKIYDPAGKVFTPKGANMLGPRMFWKGNTTADLVSAAETWKFNTIRLNMCVNSTGCFAYADNWTGHGTNDDLDAIVKAYTDKKVVVMLASHDIKPGAWPTDPQLKSLQTQWASLATKYKNNPYVWFNTMNEPGKGNDYAAVNQKWFDMQSALIKSIRDTGNKSIVVVDGSQYGQDNDGWVAKNNVPAKSSAVISRGADLTAKYSNLVFSVHVYDSYGHGTNLQMNRDRLKSYITQVQAKNLALVIGETGSDPGTWHSSPPGFVALDVAPGLGVGILAWHGQAEDAFKLVNTGSPASIDKINSKTSTPTNLTNFGYEFWRYTHR